MISASQARIGSTEAEARRLWAPTRLLALGVAMALIGLIVRGSASPMTVPARPVQALRGRVMINVAPARTLGLLPGIGPTIGRDIVAYRQKHGAFDKPAELERVPNIGPIRRRRMTPWVTFESPPGDAADAHADGVRLSPTNPGR